MNNVRNVVNESNADADKVESTINNLKNVTSKIY